MIRRRHALAALSLLLALCAAGASRATLWVSADGDDANPGTEDRPLRTIARARDVVRTLNHDMSDDITVFIGGVHRLSAPVEFGPQDSATNGYSVVYTAAPGEHPVLLGSVRVAGWACDDAARNLWSAPAPQDLQDVLGLFVAGSRAERTLGRLAQLPPNAPEGSAPPPRPQWREPAGVSYPPPAAGAIWSERGGTAPLYAANAFELLGRPGQWYFDRGARRIYYTPRPGEDLPRADVEAAVAPCLVAASGLRNRPVSGLVFKGLRFEYGGAEGEPGAAVRFNLAGAIQILEDTFVHLNGSALDLGPGCDGASVEGCTFGDVSGTALRIAWASQVSVSDSRFSYVSTARLDGAAVSLSHSGDVELANNQIDHFPGAAITEEGVRPGAARVALNLVAQPMVLADAGAAQEAARAPDVTPAGLTPAYRSILAEAVVPPSAPHPPSTVSAEAEDGFAYVAWEPPCLDGGSDVLSYTVRASTGAVLTIPAAQLRSKGYALVAGLENGKEVSFTVAAANAYGASPPSLASAAVVPARKRRLKAPQAPASATLTAGPGASTLRIAPTASDGGSPVVAYTLTEALSGRQVILEGRDVILADAAHPLVRRLEGFSPGRGSTVAVRAVNAKGPGAPLQLGFPPQAPAGR
jgi:hypothetical protein